MPFVNRQEAMLLAMTLLAPELLTIAAKARTKSTNSQVSLPNAAVKAAVTPPSYRPDVPKSTRASSAGQKVPTVEKHHMAPRKMPSTFMPSSVTVPMGGRNLKNSMMAMPIADRM